MRDPAKPCGAADVFFDFFFDFLSVFGLFMGGAFLGSFCLAYCKTFESMPGPIAQRVQS